MNTPSDSPSPVSAIETLVEKGRLSITALRDAARTGGMGFRQRDPHVVLLHDLLDQLLTLERSRQQEPEAAEARADAAEASIATLQQEPEALFKSGAFHLHSGAESDFKIDCDALTDADLNALAKMMGRRVGKFSVAEGVPRGGLRIADALNRNFAKNDAPVLIVDDVLTTGASMEAHRAGREAKGVVIFARGACPPWVTPLFTMTHPPATEDVLTRLRQILPPVTEGKQMANWQPIDQDWIKRYVDQLLEVASKLPVSSPMHTALVMRADHVMDLVKAWRERKDPRMPLPDPPVTEG